MIKEDYVSFEVAKLLKEKGFNEPCYMWYDNKGDVCAKLIVPDVPPNYFLREYYLCPSQSIVMKWLREVYNINIEMRCNKIIVEAFIMTIEDLPKCLVRGISSNKYEETVEAALKYCLKNLI